MKLNPSRYRSQSTEHYADTLDKLRIEKWDVFTGNKFFDRTYDFSSEQFYYSPDHTCVDTVGYRMRENPLFLTHESGTPPLVAFTVSDTRDILDFESEIVVSHQKDTQNYQGWGPLHHCLSVDEPTEGDAEFMTRAVAGQNPSRANASGAVFMAELRELPSLFKNLGEQMAEKGFLRGSAATHLGVSFGWAPVIRDLKKFMSIMEKVHRRMADLKELRGKGKIRRLFKEKDGRGTQTTTRTVFSSEELTFRATNLDYEDRVIRFEVTTTMETTRWAIVEFINDVPEELFPQTDGKRWTEAHRLVFGTSIDGPTIWQAMPWSWLIDWTSNASEYIKSQNNVAGHKLGETILMKETRRVTTITPVMAGAPPVNGVWSHTFIPGRLETITKERILGVQPTIRYTNESEAILGSGFKMSILASLFVQRAKVR